MEVRSMGRFRGVSGEVMVFRESWGTKGYEM